MKNEQLSFHSMKILSKIVNHAIYQNFIILKFGVTKVAYCSYQKFGIPFHTEFLIYTISCRNIDILFYAEISVYIFIPYILNFFDIYRKTKNFNYYIMTVPKIFTFRFNKCNISKFTVFSPPKAMIHKTIEESYKRWNVPVETLQSRQHSLKNSKDHPNRLSSFLHRLEQECLGQLPALENQDKTRVVYFKRLILTTNTILRKENKCNNLLSHN